MNAYYFTMAVLALVNFIVFIFLFHEKKLNYYMLAIMAIMTLSNAGNLVLALADTLDEVYLAKKIYYLGGCFIPPIMLLVIFAMCNINAPKWIRNALLMYSMVVYGMVLTLGYSDVYYIDATLYKVGDSTTIAPVYGAGHNFFYVLLYGYLALGIAVLIYSLSKKNTVSRKNLWALIGVEISTIVLFLLGKAIAPHLEVTPVTYVIDGWIFLYLNRRVTMYNLEDSIISSLDKQENYGYIMFDNHRNYLGSNAVAMGILPELETCKVDKPLVKGDALAFLDKELDEYVETGDAILNLEKNEKYYEGHIDRIRYAEKAVGYIIEIQDYTDRWKYMNLLSNYNTKLEQEVKEKTEHISNIQSKVLLGMANMVENRDDSTGGHIKRTSHVIEILINTIREHQLLPLDTRFCKAVIKAAPMHDLGKIGIDDDILRKPGRLTAEEFAIMQTHAEKSAVLVESILKDVEDEYFVKIAMNMARHHHEKWNGAGYPDHLQGEDIPMEARIMAIADVYDALVSKRCYKEAMSFEQAYDVMMESMGSHFDPQMEQVMVLSRDKLEAYYSEK